MSEINFSGGGGGGGGGSASIPAFLNLALDVAALANQAQPRIRESGRISQLQILGARPGTAIPRVYGRMRVGGQLIWNGTPKEIVNESGGDKGAPRSPVQRRYSYQLSFAIGLCHGRVNHIGRVWADGHLLDLSQYNFRLNHGEDDQQPDAIIEAEMGAGQTPAYRGLAYIVFQNFDLTPFGNRIPQLAFEVFCPTQSTQTSADLVQAVTLLPGATEFGYHPEPHIQVLGIARARGENLTAARSRTDWDISIEALQESHPHCRDIALVVAWFGDDLRADHCRLRPGVESKDKETLPSHWRVAGQGRDSAYLVSYVDARPAFGGTPSDGAVIAAIKDLRARGFRVLFYPFIMMDVPHGADLPAPEGGTQAPYPWRGRITCNPTTLNGTQNVATQVARFVNGTHAGDLYCLRGMVRHYAQICQEAGGVDAFLIGSELKGLSRLYTTRNHYPFAEELVSLAEMVRPLLPDTKISYAADWSEYGAYVPRPGSVEFPLDAFWGNDACDFIGIDAYFPLADWRDGRSHLDAAAGSITDPDYLRANMAAGEYYDWYYENTAARDAQQRTPIDDSAIAWAYRAKDVRQWWQNSHRAFYKNVAGAPTQWRAQAKPVWFTEVGCPAVDKGANQPNIFPDRLSSEGGLPHYSNGARDDHIQQAYLHAFVAHYEDPAHNPHSPVYDAPMVPRGRIYFWAWDARPFPVFPYRTDVWADGGNWHTGHWLNGRQAVTPLSTLVHDIAASGGAPPRLENIEGVLEGYAIDRLVSPRDALAPLLQAYGLDVISGGTHLRIAGRGARFVCALTPDDILVRDGRLALSITHADKATQINRLDLHYIGADTGGAQDYTPQTATARTSGKDLPVKQVALPLALSSYVAQDIAERLLYEERLAGVRAQFSLPPRYVHLEVGDIVRLRDALWRIVRLNWVGYLEIEASAFDDALYNGQAARSLSAPAANLTGTQAEAYAPPLLQIMDLPYGLAPLPSAPAGTPMVAATATPWVDSVSLVDAQKRGTQYITRAAYMGRTTSALPAAPIGRYDHSTTMAIELYHGTLQSRPLIEVLGGRNMLALKTTTGWEVMQFTTAELIGERHYRLSGLVRGLKGSEVYMDAVLPAAAELVVLDDVAQAGGESGAIVPLAAAGETLPASLCVSYGVTQLPQDSYGWRDACFDYARVGLRPLAPVHVKHRAHAGDTRFSWIRRSRVQGDDFDAAEIPLGEESEQYRIRILADDTEIYRAESPRAHWDYALAQRRAHEAAHPQAAWHIHIAQISATQGAGTEAIYNF